jgi:hypothetical protein
MSKIYSAVPGRRMSFVPGRAEVFVADALGSRHLLPIVAAIKHKNQTKNAPIERFSEQFKETMRAKGWLRI